MKLIGPNTIIRAPSWQSRLGLCTLLYICFSAQPSRAAPSLVDLDTAADFAVLAGAGITVAGPAVTNIFGDVGSWPTTSLTGFENVTLNGVNHGGDASTQAAKTNIFDAYGDAFGRAPTTTYGAIFDLGGLTLTSGVYNDPSSFGLTGTLTLDAMGDPDAVWIFQTGSTLIAEPGSIVSLIGGAQASHVFWQVGSSATLKAGSDFAGSILASESITLNAGATSEGGLYALNGAVTLDGNSITVVPEPGSAILIVCCVAVVAARTRRRTS